MKYNLLLRILTMREKNDSIFNVHSIIRVLLGADVNDMNVLIDVVKSSSILLIAPGFIDHIYKAPKWIIKLFPTCFILYPTIQVAERGASFLDISINFIILIHTTGTLLLVLTFVVER